MSPFIFTGEINSINAGQFLNVSAEGLINNVVISSPGGDIGLTYGLFDVIRFHKMDTHVVGMAQSAAAVLAQAGEWRTMTNSSLLVFHSPEKESVSDKEFRMFMQLVEMVAQRTDMHVTEALGLFDNNFITANRAMELGLIDEIAEDAKVMRWTLDGRRSSIQKVKFTPSIDDAEYCVPTGEPETGTEG